MFVSVNSPFFIIKPLNNWFDFEIKIKKIKS